jgi:hypothetical protein
MKSAGTKSIPLHDFFTNFNLLDFSPPDFRCQLKKAISLKYVFDKLKFE